MMANVITGIRILVSAALLLCPVFSPIFYAMYLIAGLSDMADGIVARKTNSVSEFGSRFDSIADFVFVAVCLIKILPVMKVTGMLLFMLPPTLSIVPLIYTGIPICSVATFAAVQEGHLIRTGEDI